MARQNINRGTVANDGNGDTLRAAAKKINDNFREIYLTIGGDSSVITSAISFVDSGLSFEGATNDAFETILGVVNPTADRKVIIPNYSGNIVLDSDTGTLKNKTLTSPVLTTPQINDTSANHQYVFAVSELAADRTVTLPLLGGNDEFVFKDHAVTMTNKTMGAMFGTVQALSGAGAVDITSLITQVTTTGSNQALTLANGANGQLKIVTMVADGGDGILTPTTFANGSTITFNDVGDSAILVYNTTGGWAVVGSTGLTIA